jgi:glycosyltransferase involved in cell wall biosynthesis
MRLFLINAPAGFVGEMSQRGHQLMVADATVAHLESRFQNPHVKFKKLWGRRKINWNAIQQMRQTIREFEPDVVHAFLPSSLAQAIVGSVGLKRRPKVVSFRGITRVPTWFDPAEWITYLSPRVAMHACESKAVMQAMTRGGIREEQCTVTYNCVSPVTTPVSRNEALAKFGIDPNAFIVGTAACIRPVKGIDLFVQAAAQCVQNKNMHFLVLGEQKDPTVLELVQTHKLTDRFHMVGHIHEAQRYMSAFDLFVMPSRREGLCRALLEAMDQSLCPIVSDAGGMKEMVRHRVDGIVFPTGDVAAFHAAIEELYHNDALRSQFGSSAQARVRDLCSPTSFADRLEALYAKLCIGS